jgi:SnoaL-like protein
LECAGRAFVFIANGEEQSRRWAAFAEDIRKSYERFQPVSWDFHEIAENGPNVLSEYSLKVEDLASGKSLSLRAMQICEIRDGLTTWAT